ncbi:MAG: cysteine--tRNA ligase [Caldilineales bacterium]|nr:cysteine--tRNA ligase [Caldilineales bacterium]
MTLRVYNTLSRQKEPFETLTPGVVRMYVCGPTVYDDAHIGHGMSTLVFDVIRRYLEFKGYEVRHVMNFTDVDDKIIQRARALGRDAFAIADGYVEQYQRHMIELGVLPPTVLPRVSQTIAEIIDMVQTLIAQGYAYESEGDVYFRVRQDEDYGKLSRRTIEHALSSDRARFGDDLKEDAADFALWKAQKAPDEPAWPSPWGLGRPGWHIECSAMARRYLGPTLDIHGGGNDLIFPHHENEIAQSESCNAAPMARFWIHNGMLQLRGEKMSKSLGNIISLHAFLAAHEADAFRLLVLGSHYRKPLAIDDEIVGQAERGLERLRGALRPPTGSQSSGPAVAALVAAADAARARFIAAMDDDFNTAAALGHLYDLVKAINTARDEGVAGPDFAQAQAALLHLSGVLGLRLVVDAPAAPSDAAPFIDLLIEIRRELRQARQWALADLIRDRLAAMGVGIEDSREGATWRWER